MVFFWEAVITESLDCAGYGEDAIASYSLFCLACAA